MSLIRLCTPVKRAKKDRRYSKSSDTYAWEDVNGYYVILNGWRRSKIATGKTENGLVYLTPAEMRFLVRSFCRQTGFKP